MEMWGIEGIGEVHPGDVLADLITDAIFAMAASDPSAAVRDGDVLVVTQKIVSKAEGRVVAIDPDDPLSHKQLVEEEAVRVVRRRGDLIVTETKHGFVCANAGIDLSNMERDGPRSCRSTPIDRRRIRDGVPPHGMHGRRGRLRHVRALHGPVGLALANRHRLLGRPADPAPLPPDALGRTMQVTEVCIADELAGAAEMVMGKSNGIPVAVVRGVDPTWLRESSVRDEIVRSPQEDLFR
jgi:coenzyme F420-0:L-glutamate ligase/coenzyme F420-1:gamma-L-glutamate ligase